MKIAVLNTSGNVGKTTIARHLLAPRMGTCPLMFVETINEGGDINNVRGRDFKHVLIELATLDNGVVDIGSSNIEAVFTQLKNMADAHEDFDFYVVPTVPSLKQQKDTANTLRELIALGIPAFKIRLIFNQVEDGDSVEKVFPDLVKVAQLHGLATDAVIHINEVYSLLGNNTIEDAIAADVDYKTLLQNAKDTEEKRKLATALSVSRLAKGAKKELDKVFESLFANATA